MPFKRTQYLLDSK